jgi:hypothetical protein
MKKLFYTLDEFIYVVVLCSRSFQQFPECRRSTEGSTEGHYTDWALAHHISYTKETSICFSTTSS